MMMTDDTATTVIERGRKALAQLRRGMGGMARCRARPG